MAVGVATKIVAVAVAAWGLACARAAGGGSGPRRGGVGYGRGGRGGAGFSHDQLFPRKDHRFAGQVIQLQQISQGNIIGHGNGDQRLVLAHGVDDGAICLRGNCGGQDRGTCGLLGGGWLLAELLEDE